MIHKIFESIGIEDIRALIENKVLEGKTLEYKSKISLGKDAEKKEFLFDISSFANASGGDIIFGVEENQDGEPTELPGIHNQELDGLILQIEAILRSGINPRIPNIKIKCIPNEEEKSIMILRIPHSYLLPHQVIFNGTDKFYSRGTNGKFKLDVNELRSVFLRSGSVERKMKEFRQERLSNLISNEEILPLTTDSKLMIHLIPLQALTEEKPIDITKVQQNPAVLRPFGGGNWRDRNIFDGYICYSPSPGTPTSNDSYAQIFRTGIIETASCLRFKPHQGKDYLPSFDFTESLIKAIKSYLELASFVNTDVPYYLALTLVGVKGKFLGVSKTFPFDEFPIEKSLLDFPVITIESKDEIQVENLIKEWLDLLWRASGRSRCTFYHENGDWIGIQ